MSTLQIAELLILGFVSGVLGGLLGIGGSIIMIPALAIVLGPNQHLYQAAAMIVHVFVALPSSIPHWRAGAIRWDVFKRMLPFGAVFILIGVAVSDLFNADVLQAIFGCFLLYIVVNNIVKLIQRRGEPQECDQRPGWAYAGSVGAVMGFMAGLLGIGGGVIAVPLLQRVCNLPLRQCIATTSAVMCLTAIIGAYRKNSTLAQHLDAAGQPLEFQQSLIIAGCMIPAAVMGGLIGAALTHKLPLRWVRMALIVLMIFAAAKMLRVF